MPYAQISYFKHFNAMRFVAAFLVLVHHAEQIRLKEGLANFKACSVANFGHGAVLFFFVLSGFLITFLLLKERAQTHTICTLDPPFDPVFYSLVVAGTIGVAWCSKRWFENRFLRLKKINFLKQLLENALFYRYDFDLPGGHCADRYGGQNPRQ